MLNPAAEAATMYSGSVQYDRAQLLWTGNSEDNEISLGELDSFFLEYKGFGTIDLLAFSPPNDAFSNTTHSSESTIFTVYESTFSPSNFFREDSLRSEETPTVPFHYVSTQQTTSSTQFVFSK